MTDFLKGKAVAILSRLDEEGVVIVPLSKFGGACARLRQEIEGSIVGATEEFERAFDDDVSLARNVLANVSDSYSEEQLKDIGARARYWVLRHLREELK